MILVSACLLGINCKYNGENNRNDFVLELGKKVPLVPVCPEQLGGLPTPRVGAEITGGGGKEVLGEKARVVNQQGEEVTSYFLKGAAETLRLAEILGSKMAIFKSNSPSCGSGFIYSGEFDGKLKEGEGVTAALLKEKGLLVLTENIFLKKEKKKKIKGERYGDKSGCFVFRRVGQPTGSASGSRAGSRGGGDYLCYSLFYA